MSTTTTKEFAEQVISRLPDDATMEDIQYSLYVAELVRSRASEIDEVMKGGLEEAIRRRKLIPHDEVVKRMLAR